MIRRTPLLAAAVAALALAVPATAGAERTEFGTGAQPGVSFIAKLRGNEVISVKKFTFFDIALQCDQGILEGVENRGEPLPKMGVSNNRFDDTFTGGNGQKVEVSGKFSNKGEKAEGKLRIRGDFPDPNGVAFTNCDSGKIQWKAGA